MHGIPPKTYLEDDHPKYLSCSCQFCRHDPPAVVAMERTLWQAIGGGLEASGGSPTPQYATVAAAKVSFRSMRTIIDSRQCTRIHKDSGSAKNSIQRKFRLNFLDG